MEQSVIAFLKKNGFERMEKNSYANSKCNVTYQVKLNCCDGYYAVANNDGSTMYSKDENIYWLIGVLTYYGYMDKNYKEL